MFKSILSGLVLLYGTAWCLAVEPAIQLTLNSNGEWLCVAGEHDCFIEQAESVELSGFEYLVRGEVIRRHTPINEFDSGEEVTSFLSVCSGLQSDGSSTCKELLQARTNLYRFESIDLNRDGKLEWALMGITGFHSSFIEIFSVDPPFNVNTIFSHITNTPNLALQKDDRGYFVEFEKAEYDPDYETGSRNLQRIRVNPS